MTVVKITKKFSNCMDCEHHQEVRDPDPDDWFCDDDVAVLCTVTKPRKDSGFPYRVITCACRPYNTRKECDIPDWCPLRNLQAG
jgi:hypothetical protein